MKIRKILAYVLFVCVLGTQMCYSVYAAKYEKSTGVEEDYLQTEAKVPKIYSDAAILMDAKTGEILFAKNAQKKEYPASITKCMTSLVAIENNDLSDEMTYSENAIYNVEEGSSGAALDVGEKLTVEQSLYAAMLESANEACNGLAEQTAGTIDAFVDMMNEKAQSLGCVNTHFANPNGLYNKNHYTCAYDMALIVREAMQNEDWRKICQTVVYEVPPTNKMDETRYWRNHHSFVNLDEPYDTTTYTVEGGKTGYTVKCKNTLVSYAKSNTSDMELICVVMRCEDYYYNNGHSRSRVYTDTANLFDYGFNNFTTISSSVDFQSLNENQELNYIQQAYEMLQPEKFISFRSDNDCQIVVSNTYDSANLQGTLVYDKDAEGGESGHWGVYEYTSAGNVIASTDVYYDLNMDVIGELYHSSRKSNNLSKIRNIILYAGILVVLMLLVIGIVQAVRHFSLVSIFKRKTIRLGTLNQGRGMRSFKPSKRRRGAKRSSYGTLHFDDRRRRKRRRRSSRNSGLHF